MGISISVRQLRRTDGFDVDNVGGRNRRARRFAHACQRTSGCGDGQERRGGRVVRLVVDTHWHARRFASGSEKGTDRRRRARSLGPRAEKYACQEHYLRRATDGLALDGEEVESGL